MRDILARYLGIDAEALEFRSGAHGKPQLEFGGLEFNLTHSDDVCYVAIAGDAAVGIDGITKEQYGQALERNIRKALKAIDRLAAVRAKSALIRIEDSLGQ